MTDIMESLAKSKAAGIYQTVISTGLPTLCAALGAARQDEPWVIESAIDLINGLIRGAPEGGIGEGVFALLAPGLFATLSSADDRDVLQVNMLVTFFCVATDLKP